MFKKINEGTVQNNSGFSMQIIGRGEILQYRQDNYAVEIGMGYDPSIRKIYIYASEVAHWDEPKNTILNENAKIKLINNIKEAVKLLTGNFEVK